MKKEDADQLIRCIKECWWRVLLVIAIPAFLMVLLTVDLPDTVTIQDGIAAWAQVFAVFAAIVGSLWAGRHQARAAIKSVEKAQVLRLEENRQTALTIADAALKRIEGLKRVFSEEKTPRLKLHQVFGETLTSSIIGALGSIQINNLNSPDAVLAVLDLRDQFGYLDQAIKNYLSGPDGSPEISENIAKSGLNEKGKIGLRQSYEKVLSENVVTQFKCIEDHCKKLREALGRKDV